MGIQSIDVTEQNQKISGNELRHQRRKPVIIAEPNFLGRHCVVFVDDRQDTQSQQSFDRAERVRAVSVVFNIPHRQQHLPRNHRKRVEKLLIAAHQQVLPHSGCSLLGGQILGTIRQFQKRRSGGDSTRRHQHNLFALRVPRG